MDKLSSIETPKKTSRLHNLYKGNVRKTVIGGVVAATAVGGLIATKSGGAKSPDKAAATATANPDQQKKAKASSTTTTTKAPASTTTTTTEQAPAAFNASANMCNNADITAAAQKVLGSTVLTCAHGYTPYSEGIDAYGTHWDTEPFDADNEVGFQLLSFSPGHSLSFKGTKGVNTTVDGYHCVMDTENELICEVPGKGMAETNLPAAGGQDKSIEANKAFMEELLAAASE